MLKGTDTKAFQRGGGRNDHNTEGGEVGGGLTGYGSIRIHVTVRRAAPQYVPRHDDVVDIDRPARAPRGTHAVFAHAR